MLVTMLSNGMATTLLGTDVTVSIRMVYILW